jgi:hypothetical protein
MERTLKPPLLTVFYHPNTIFAMILLSETTQITITLHPIITIITITIIINTRFKWKGRKNHIFFRIDFFFVSYFQKWNLSL